MSAKKKKPAQYTSDTDEDIIDSVDETGDISPENDEIAPEAAETTVEGDAVVETGDISTVEGDAVVKPVPEATVVTETHPVVTKPTKSEVAKTMEPPVVKKTVVNTVKSEKTLSTDVMMEKYETKFSHSQYQKRLSVTRTMTLFNIVDNFKRSRTVFIGLKSKEDYDKIEKLITSNQVELRGVILDDIFISDMLGYLKMNTSYVVSHKL